MTIQNAQASLTSEFIQVTITGFVYYEDGEIDTQSGFVKATGSATWSSLSGLSWNNYSNYLQTFNTIKWTAPLLDLGAVQYFTLNIDVDYDGDISYLIHVSEVGNFSGEEKEYYVKNGDTDVPGFYGRFVYVTAIVTGKELRDMTVTADSTVREYIIPNVDSSTLSGTNTNRIIALPTPVSLIKDIHIQPKAATSYAVNLYVSDTATSEILIPVVKSKSGTTPSFALYGIDNDPRDGIVDITVSALPRQVMFGGNLVVLQ
jgi:hypothetical protein